MIANLTQQVSNIRVTVVGFSVEIHASRKTLEIQNVVGGRPLLQNPNPFRIYMNSGSCSVINLLRLAYLTTGLPESTN